MLPSLTIKSRNNPVRREEKLHHPCNRNFLPYKVIPVCSYYPAHLVTTFAQQCRKCNSMERLQCSSTQKRPFPHGSNTVMGNMERNTQAEKGIESVWKNSKKRVTADVFSEAPDTIGVSQDTLWKFSLHHVSIDLFGKNHLFLHLHWVYRWDRLLSQPGSLWDIM